MTVPTQQATSMTELEIAVLRTIERMDFIPAGKEVYATFVLHHLGTTVSYKEIKQALNNLVKAGKLTYDRVDYGDSEMENSRPHFRYFLKRGN